MQQHYQKWSVCQFTLFVIVWYICTFQLFRLLLITKPAETLVWFWTRKLTLTLEDLTKKKIQLGMIYVCTYVHTNIATYICTVWHKILIWESIFQTFHFKDLHITHQIFFMLNCSFINIFHVNILYHTVCTYTYICITMSIGYIRIYECVTKKTIWL